MISAALTLTALATTAAVPLPEPPARPVILLPTVAAAERVLLPRLRGPIELRVDPLRATVEIMAPRDLGAVAAKISSGLGHICPRWEVTAGKVLLKCRSPRLHAKLSEQAGRRYVDIQELRGMPREGDDQQIPLFYEPSRSGAGGPCPGTTPAGRGECLLRDGKDAEAEVQFKLGLETYDRPLAALRMGDLYARRGDFNAAALMWNRAGTLGPFGRLAAARQCELRGSCMESRGGSLFDGGELREPMRTELALRAARVDAFAGRFDSVLKRLGDVLARTETGGCVSVGGQFCRRLILWALEHDKADDEGRRKALELYLSLPGRTKGPHDMEMGRAAAERAAALGAAVFGGNLLASVAGSVPEAELPGHLLRTAELYLAGGDRPRAQLLLDYAESRLLPRQLGGVRWANVRKGLASPVDPARPGDESQRLEREILTTEAARDLANAMTALARVRISSP